MSQIHWFWLFETLTFIEQVIHSEKILLIKTLFREECFHKVASLFQKLLQGENMHNMISDVGFTNACTWKVIVDEIIHITRILFLVIEDF